VAACQTLAQCRARRQRTSTDVETETRAHGAHRPHLDIRVAVPACARRGREPVGLGRDAAAAEPPARACHGRRARAAALQHPQRGGARIGGDDARALAAHEALVRDRGGRGEQQKAPDARGDADEGAAGGVGGGRGAAARAVVGGVKVGRVDRVCVQRVEMVVLLSIKNARTTKVEISDVSFRL